MQSTIIAIDGFASTGKSTLSKRLAHHLGYTYVDTGYMFRAICHQFVQAKGVPNHPLSEADFDALLSNCLFEWKIDADGKQLMAMNGRVFGDEIRTPAISDLVSKVAVLSNVRTHLLNQQRSLSKATSVVMDGRDIGTVVFPKAQFKFFLTADPEERAKRRFEEMKAKGISVDYKSVLKNVQERDLMDSTREIAPLKKAEDAIEIDTTSLNIDEVFSLLLSYLGSAN